ncbi:hypothetical protein BDW62DRAFT_198179 [Aspergillus aurantiobrunneus]
MTSVSALKTPSSLSRLPFVNNLDTTEIILLPLLLILCYTYVHSVSARSASPTRSFLPIDLDYDSTCFLNSYGGAELLTDGVRVMGERGSGDVADA